MKAIFFIVLFGFLQNVVLSQDTAIVKYLPLKVGNVWVYHFFEYHPYGGSEGFEKYRVTGTAVYNNQNFYAIKRSVYNIYGSYSCHPRLFSSYSDTNILVRVDSISGIIYRGTNCGTDPFSLIDSLKSRLHDSAVICGNLHGQYSVCTDTSSQTIFGLQLPSRKFYCLGFEGYDSQRYIKNIGLTSYWFNQLMQTCDLNLWGCLLNGILYGDTNMVTGLIRISNKSPDKFTLFQNYPNPFNPKSKIKFQITKSGFVKLTVFEELGKNVTQLVSKNLNPGTYEVVWDGTNYPSGVYFYKLIVTGHSTGSEHSYSEIKKMVLLK